MGAAGVAVFSTDGGFGFSVSTGRDTRLAAKERAQFGVAILRIQNVVSVASDRLRDELLVFMVE
jgi:hypothetical protein